VEQVREVMTDNIESCTLVDNVFEVAVKMKELNVGAIPILDQDKLVGMITGRDIVVRGVAEKHPGSTKVEDCSPAIKIGTLTHADFGLAPFSRTAIVIFAACSPVSKQSVWGAHLYPTNASQLSCILFVIVVCISRDEIIDLFETMD